MRIVILNSKGYSEMGWVTEPATQRNLAALLSRAGADVTLSEVENTAELDTLLASLAEDTLVWPNAYNVRVEGDERDIGSAETVWLADVLETRGMPFVGSPSSALRAMLHKNETQKHLAAMGIPIPRFTVVTESAPEALRSAMGVADLSWPVVVKATSTAGSLGVDLADDLQRLSAQVSHTLEHHGPRVMLEEFLPSTDLTVGVLMRGSEATLLPTWYEFAGHEQDTQILDVQARLVPWGGAKRMRMVEDRRILEQVEAVIPLVVEGLGIRDTTRIDCRLDQHGTLRVFDVNGMPGLEYPESVMLQQVMEIWQEPNGLTALDMLACSVAVSAAERYALEVPHRMAAHAECLARVGPLPVMT